MSYLYDCQANHFIKVDGDINGVPHLMWHITYQCAFQCKFCFAKKRKEKVDRAELGKYVEKLKELSVQKVDISGGEPLQYPFLKELCDKLYQNKIGQTRIA